MPALLVGPPEINLMVEQFNSLKIPGKPPMAYTENHSATFLSTANPCLDFFFHVVPDTSSETIIQRHNLSWNHDPLTTLKLICNLRGVRGKGKSDKELYYASALWLHKFHPKTLACDVACMAEFGYFKDLPEILYRILEGADVREKRKADKNNRNRGYGSLSKRYMKRRCANLRKRGGRIFRRRRYGFDDEMSKMKKKEPREVRMLAEMNKVAKEKATARIAREEKKNMMAKKAIERYRRDPDYKFLFDRISDYFGDCLRKDIEFLNSNKLNKISLAAKWCPSLDSMFDKSTLICESIARRIFPRGEYPEYAGIDDAHYAYRVRDRLRKQILVPLRKALELPEVYMGANNFGSIPYNRVASVAMKTYKEIFLKHDKERFKEYLQKVKEGKATITAGALLPHEIIAALGDGDGGEVAELQWKRMVEDLFKEGKLNNCLAICDVSLSMMGTPMEVCIALGVLVSELSEEPWKGKVVTFSHNPTLEMVIGDDLKAKTGFVRSMEWGYNTDFQKVFDLILEVAVTGNLKEDEMIKRLFVFSDMEFDKASSSEWETDYMTIVEEVR